MGWRGRVLFLTPGGVTVRKMVRIIERNWILMSNTF